MLELQFVSDLLDKLGDIEQIDFSLDVTFVGSQWVKRVTSVKGLYGEEIEEIEIEFPLPVMADFETRIYCEHMSEIYEELPLTWGFHDLTVTVTGPFNLENFESFCDDVQSVNGYCDVSDIDGYYDERNELMQESLKDYGLYDFIQSLRDFMFGLYPLVDIDDITDYDDIDCEWINELFNLTLTDDYIEGNSFVFNHDLEDYEDEIVNTLQSELGLSLDDNCPVDDLIPFGSVNSLYYPAMSLVGFTMTQLSNIVWLQENETWSDNNMIFVSGQGFYIHFNRYTRQVIKAISEDKVLSVKTMRDLASKMAKTESSWWANWQKVTKGLSKIEGLEYFLKHYKHDDKYDVVAKEIFLKLVDSNPEFCSLDRNWWALKIDTKIVPDEGTIWSRHNRALSEFSINFDFDRAIEYQIATFDSFLGSLKHYCDKRISNIENKPVNEWLRNTRYKIYRQETGYDKNLLMYVDVHSSRFSFRF